MLVALEKLTRAEKFQLMEALWVDLSRDTAALPSPDWHQQALQDAQTALRNGEAHFVDWAQARHKLRSE